jgi:hypothetical protein
LEANGVQVVGADLMIHLDQALHDDELDLTVRQGVLQAVAENEEHREALARLVRASRRLRRLKTDQSSISDRSSCRI